MTREEVVRRSKERCQHLPCAKCGALTRKKNSAWCQSCHTESNKLKWRSWSTELQRDKWLRNKYKIRYSDYEKMYESQNGLCAVCRTELDLTKKDNSRHIACVDHSHKTNKVRGLLCNHCNRALGLLKEDKQTIKNLLEYVCLHT